MRDKAHETNGGLFSQVGAKVIDLLSALHLLFGDMRRSAQAQFDRFLRRAEYMFVLFLWISIGILFAILGVFDLLIDKAGISRGIVFSVGGAFIFLTAVVLLQAAKIRQSGK